MYRDKEKQKRYHREYYRRHKKKREKWRHNHPDEIREHDIAYRKRHPERMLLRSAKSRAEKSDLPFDLKESDIKIPEMCPILNIPIYINAGKGITKHSPSLDRIIPHLGYVKGNIVVISWRANKLKNDGVLCEFKQIVKYLKKVLDKGLNGRKL